MAGMQKFYEKEGEYVTIAELLQWVREHPLPDGRCIPVLIWGSRGSGKTSQIKAFCDENDLDMRIYHPAHDVNGQDIVGTPITDPEDPTKTIHALPEWLPKEDGSKGVWFIDEINRASTDVLAGLMEPLGEGTISQSNWKIPKGWQIVCAANPAEVGYLVNPIDEAMVDRMLHYNPGWEAPVWAKWALSSGIHEDVVDFALRRPNEIVSAQDLGEFQLPPEVENKMVASPRALTYFASLYEKDMPERLLKTIGFGLLGREATESFIEMKQANMQALDGDAVLGECRRNSNGEDVYPYDQYLTQWSKDPVFGEELMAGTTEHMIVSLVAADDPVSHDPHENRKAQLAGRFLARLPSHLRERAFETLARSAPNWFPIVKEATLLWLQSFAHHGKLLETQSEPLKLESSS